MRLLQTRADGTNPVPQDWRLTVPLGQSTLSLNLSDSETQALALKLRASAFDEGVSVLEIGSRVNLLNVDHVLGQLRPLLAAGTGFVILFPGRSCLIDEITGGGFKRQ